MCNEFALEQNLEELAALFAGTPELPLFGWEGGLLPNNTQGRASIRISDVSPVVRLAGGALSGAMLHWAGRGRTARRCSIIAPRGGISAGPTGC